LEVHQKYDKHEEANADSLTVFEDNICVEQPLTSNFQGSFIENDPQLILDPSALSTIQSFNISPQESVGIANSLDLNDNTGFLLDNLDEPFTVKNENVCLRDLLY